MTGVEELGDDATKLLYEARTGKRTFYYVGGGEGKSNDGEHCAVLRTIFAKSRNILTAKVAEKFRGGREEKQIRCAMPLISTVHY